MKYASEPGTDACERTDKGGVRAMCLATVYKESDNTVICRNVSRIDVDGEKITLRDILGEESVVTGRILMVDLANSVVKLICD